MSEVNSQKEVIKCVFVGDTGVGKTKLICSHVCCHKMTMEQLTMVHIPTVWAMDPHRIYNIVVDGVKVTYRPWDTFGDHKNDRCFAYNNANVVLICFSVVNKKSLKNVKIKWYPEIKRNCPNTALILLACKTDLRYMWLDHEFKQLMLKRPRSINSMKPEDMVYSSEGRAMAEEIGAFYYETSVLNSFGVEEVFQNMVRVAFASRRLPFWRFANSMPSLQFPTLQLPQLPPKPKYVVPNVQKHASHFDTDLSSIFNVNDALSDVSIICGMETFQVHRLIIAAGSQTFWDILVGKNDDCRLFADIAVTKTVINAEHWVLTVAESDDCTKSALHAGLQFLYSGTILDKLDDVKLQKLNEIANILQIHEISIAVENLQKYNKSLNNFVKIMFIIKRNKQLYKLSMDLGLFTDVLFMLQNHEIMMAHKFLLAARCDFFKSLFCNGFQEAQSSQAVFPDISKKSFTILLQYLYTDDLPADCKNMSSILACLDLANRFCLPLFQSLLEMKVVRDPTLSKYRSFDDIILLVQYAQLHNAKHVLEWCLQRLSCNYSLLNENMLSKLSLTNQNCIKIHRWPPAWYFEECDFYDLVVRERQNSALIASKKKNRDCVSFNPITEIRGLIKKS